LKLSVLGGCTMLIKIASQSNRLFDITPEKS
jgi:hypothetical protein